MTLTENSTYSFEQLEAFLKEADRGSYLLVENLEYKHKAVMHVFGGNFCGDWMSGDGVLFYDNGEVHSANPEDEFRLIKKLEIR